MAKNAKLKAKYQRLNAKDEQLKAVSNNLADFTLLPRAPLDGYQRSKKPPRDKRETARAKRCQIDFENVFGHF